MTTIRRDRAMLPAVLLTAFACCPGTPAQAASGTGGAEMPVVLPAKTGGTGYGDAGTRALVVSPSLLLGQPAVVRGTMPHAGHRTVILQRRDARRGWRNVARARVHSSSRFRVSWRPDRSGLVSLRAVLAPRRRGSEHRRVHSAAKGEAAAPAGVPPVVAVTVYRPALATFYGPGFFGKQTACGQTLTPEMHGVAHRRLPCGTLVLIMYRGREITVPVIDRGPFNGDYDWDLTQATADALGFQAGGIGYVRVTPAPAPAT